MKKLLILAAAFLFSFQISQAQTEKGTQNLGANLQFVYANSNSLSINSYPGTSANYNTKSTTIIVGPNYSYFIADKLDLGASFDIWFSKL